MGEGIRRNIKKSLPEGAEEINGDRMKTEIIHEDKDILVCHKPSGIAVQTSKVGETDVVSELKNYLAAKNAGNMGYLGIIHRLDQPVEGLLVFAKNKNAASKLTKQLQDGSLNKDYLAVVCRSRDTALPLEGTLINEIAKSPDNRAVVRDVPEIQDQETCDLCPGSHGLREKDGLSYKKAVLHYKMTQMSCKEHVEPVLFLAEIHIDTGRFHQIRAQMSYAGYPIVGDMKYGDDTSVTLAESLRITRVLLFADKIKFTHPVTSHIMEFEIHPQNPFFTEYGYQCSLQKV